VNNGFEITNEPVSDGADAHVAEVSNEVPIGDPVLLSPVSSVIPSGEGTSKDKGKGIDPGNFGGIDFLGDVDDLEAQKQALDNFAEINRIIKQERVTTPPDFFKGVPPVKTPEPEDEVPKVKFAAAKPSSAQKDHLETHSSGTDMVCPCQTEDFCHRPTDTRRPPQIRSRSHRHGP
jgi:hypothetical protein